MAGLATDVDLVVRAVTVDGIQGLFGRVEDKKVLAGSFVVKPNDWNAELLGEDGDYDLGRLQSLFLFSRSDTIYGGTNQIQRDIVGNAQLLPDLRGSGGHEG